MHDLRVVPDPHNRDVLVPGQILSEGLGREKPGAGSQ
jgi:hypothetical protein